MDFCYKNSEYGIHIKDQGFSKGQVVAVIGHNGAGKSTFLRCLSGLQKNVKAEMKLLMNLDIVRLDFSKKKKKYETLKKYCDLKMINL